MILGMITMSDIVFTIFAIFVTVVSFIILLGLGAFCVAMLIVHYHQEHRRNGE